MKLKKYRYEFDGRINEVKAKTLKEAKEHVFEIGEIPYHITEIPINYIKWLPINSYLVG
jgi:hypothetical protein